MNASFSLSITITWAQGVQHFVHHVQGVHHDVHHFVHHPPSHPTSNSLPFDHFHLLYLPLLYPHQFFHSYYLLSHDRLTQ